MRGHPNEIGSCPLKYVFTFCDLCEVNVDATQHNLLDYSLLLVYKTYYASLEIYRAERKRLSALDCFVTLVVDAVFTESDVKKAYCRLASNLHPDAGGDAEDFKKLRCAYEQALEIIENTSHGEQWKDSKNDQEELLPGLWCGCGSAAFKPLLHRTLLGLWRPAWQLRLRRPRSDGGGVDRTMARVHAQTRAHVV